MIMNLNKIVVMNIFMKIFKKIKDNISLSLYLENLNIHQPIYDRYDSESEFYSEDEQDFQSTFFNNFF
jgi:hypothetical protein